MIHLFVRGPINYSGQNQFSSTPITVDGNDNVITLNKTIYYKHGTLIWFKDYKQLNLNESFIQQGLVDGDMLESTANPLILILTEEIIKLRKQQHGKPKRDHAYVSSCSLRKILYGTEIPPLHEDIGKLESYLVNIKHNKGTFKTISSYLYDAFERYYKNDRDEEDPISHMLLRIFKRSQPNTNNTNTNSNSKLVRKLENSNDDIDTETESEIEDESIVPMNLTDNLELNSTTSFLCFQVSFNEVPILSQNIDFFKEVSWIDSEYKKLLKSYPNSNLVEIPPIKFIRQPILQIKNKSPYNKSKKKLEYSVRFGSVPCAFLIGLLNDDEPQEEDIAFNQAQQFTTQDIRDPESSMMSKYEKIQNLKIKGYVKVSSISKNTYSLTEKGKELASYCREFYYDRKTFTIQNNITIDTFQNEVDIVIDHCEYKRDSLIRNFNELGMNSYVKAIPSGDYIFVKRQIDGGTKLVNSDDFTFYPFLFERKTWMDLEGSIVDGRIDLQRIKMRSCSLIKKRFLIVEGEESSYRRIKGNQSLKLLWNAINEMVQQEGFYLMRSSSLLDTCKQLAMVGKMLQSDPMLDGLYQCDVPFSDLRSSVQKVKRSNNPNELVPIVTDLDRFYIKWNIDQLIQFILHQDYRNLIKKKFLKYNHIENVLIINGYLKFIKEIFKNIGEYLKEYLIFKNSFVTSEDTLIGDGSHSSTYKDGYYSKEKKIEASKHLDLDYIHYYLVLLQFMTGCKIYIDINEDDEKNILKSFTENEKLLKKFEIEKFNEIILKPIETG